MARLAPKPEVIRRLFALSGNVCAFPSCTHPLINDNGIFVAQICHIEGAEEGGERYNQNQSDEDRRAFENLMIMCYQHHVETDDVLTYPMSLLKKIKNEHEAKFVNSAYELPSGIEYKVIEDIHKKLVEIYDVVSASKNLIEENNRIDIENKDSLTQMHTILKEIQSGKTLKIDETGIYSEQLDFITQLRKANKARTALDSAIQFKNTKWTQLNDELKFKIIANIAGILFDLGRQEEAAKYLLELTGIKYEKGETLAYLTLAYAILNDKPNFDKTFDNAVADNNKSVNLWVAYIYMQDEQISPETIKDAIPGDILEKPEILFTLGEALVDRGCENEGFEMLEKSLAQNNDTSTVWQIKAIYAAKKLIKIITIEKTVFNKFTESELQQIRGAVDRLSEAWACIRDTELATTGWHILLNRGIANRALGQIEKADYDLEESFRLSHKFDALKNLILHYIDTDRPNKADVLLQSKDAQNFSENENFDLQALKARVLMVQGRADDAVQLLASQLGLYHGEHKLRLLDLITLVYFDCGAYEKALPYAIQMTEEFKGLPNGYLASGVCYGRMGNIRQAVMELDESLSFVDNSPAQKLLHIFQIGMEYKCLKEYTKAARSFERILNEHRYDPTFINLVLSYFYGNELENCVALCLKGKVLSPEDSTLNEILFRVYDELGENEKVEEILRQQLQSRDTSSFDHFRLLGIQFYKKTGNNNKAIELCLQITSPEILPLQQRMGIAHVLITCGKIDEGLNMAYDARLDNYEQSDSHVAYLQVCALRPRDQKDDIQPDTINANVAFVLRDEDSKDNVFFLTDDKRIFGADVIRTTDSLGRKTLGKRIGDIVEMASNVGIGNHLTVVSIFSKHMYAFRDSKELLETKYVDESGMIFFHGQEGNFALMHDFIRQQAIKANKQKDELYSLYKRDMATLGMLAQHQNKTQVEVWFEMMGSNVASLLCYTHDEFGDMTVIAENEMRVVIDCVGLLTTFMLLDKPDLLNNCNFKWAITQSTIEELQAYKEHLQLLGPGISIGFQEGELRKGELTKEHIDAQTACIDRIIGWCGQNALIKTPRRIVKSIGVIENVSDLIGVSSHDAILLANQIGGAIMADDAKLKTLGSQMYGLPTFSTYQLLVYNARNKFISNEQFIEYYRTLIRANYTFIPVTGADLWLFFDENSYKIQYSFVTASKGLRIMRTELTAIIVVDFAKRVFLNLAVKALRDYVLLYVLTELKRRNDFPQIKFMIGVLTSKVFNLMQVQANEFLSLFDANH